MSNIIEVKNLVKNYKDVHAVNDISFTVEEGSFFAFLGINGAGKSTTINILCTVLEKTSGNVKIGGYDLDKEKNKIKELIGIVFQGSVLDKQLTVKENLESRASYYGLNKKEIAKRIESLTQTFDLSEILKRKYGTLSGGQRRRVDIARALINRPKLLFLDEPTTGLDPKTRLQVWEIIHNLRKETGLTVFLTTHYMEEASEADYVVIIDSGKKVAEGTPLELKNKYVGDYMLIYNTDEDKIKRLNLSYEKIPLGYRIEVKDTKEATELIKNNSDLFIDYELIKGKMDDVFLRVTGKSLEVK